jgi:urease accessory protein
MDSDTTTTTITMITPPMAKSRTRPRAARCARSALTGGRVRERGCAGPAAETTAPCSLTLALLMIWLSPAFPVGAYCYSHGLEWVVACGDVVDARSLRAWIAGVLAHGAGRSDVILLAETWRAVAADDAAALACTAELAAALAPSAERRVETLAQGAAFLKAVAAAWPRPLLTQLSASGADIAYPVAVGAAAAAHGLPLPATAQMFCQAFVANLVSAGVRLIPLGQTDGVSVLAQLARLIPPLVTEALAAGLEDVGGAAIAADIASMCHETQYSRLFRS